MGKTAQRNTEVLVLVAVIREFRTVLVPDKMRPHLIADVHQALLDYSTGAPLHRIFLGADAVHHAQFVRYPYKCRFPVN